MNVRPNNAHRYTVSFKNKSSSFIQIIMGSVPYEQLATCEYEMPDGFQTLPVSFEQQKLAFLIMYDGREQNESFDGKIIVYFKDGDVVDILLTVTFSPEDAPIEDDGEDEDSDMEEEEDEIDSEGLKCTICYRPFSAVKSLRKPRILNCGHSFCTKCLKRMCENNSPKCPNGCATAYYAAVNKMAVNWSLVHVVKDKAQTRTEQTRNPKQKCCENDHHEATLYCKTCKLDYCQNCFTNAHSVKFMSNHEEVPISEKPKPLPKCHNHPNKEAEFICLKSGCEFENAICGECLKDTHKKHKHETLNVWLDRKDEAIQEYRKTFQSQSDEICKLLDEFEQCEATFDVTHSGMKTRKNRIQRKNSPQKNQELKKLESWRKANKRTMDSQWGKYSTLDTTLQKYVLDCDKYLRREHDITKADGFIEDCEQLVERKRRLAPAILIRSTDHDGPFGSPPKRKRRVRD